MDWAEYFLGAKLRSAPQLPEPSPSTRTAMIGRHSASGWDFLEGLSTNKHKIMPLKLSCFHIGFVELPFDTPFFSKKGLSGMEECPPKLPRCTKHNPGKKPGRCGVEAGPSRAAARAQLLQIMAAEKMVGPRTGAGPVLTATGRLQNGTIRKMGQKQELNSQYTSPILNICHS